MRELETLDLRYEACSSAVRWDCVARAGLMRCVMVMAKACCARAGCVAGGTDTTAAGENNNQQ